MEETRLPVARSSIMLPDLGYNVLHRRTLVCTLAAETDGGHLSHGYGVTQSIAIEHIHCSYTVHLAGFADCEMEQFTEPAFDFIHLNDRNVRW